MKWEVIFLCGLLAGASLPVKAQAGKADNKVVIATLANGQELAEYIPDFTNLSDLLIFTEENLIQSPNKVLTAFAKFQQTHSSESINNQFYFELANVYIGLERTAPLKNLLAFIDRKTLTTAEEVELLILKSKITLASTPYEAENKLIQAYQLALSINESDKASYIAIDLYVLLSQLGLQARADEWLSKAYSDNEKQQQLAAKLEFLYHFQSQLMQLNKYDTALLNNLKLIELAEQNKLSLLVANLQMERADIFLLSKQPQQAISLLEPIFNTAQKQRNFVLQFRSLVATMQAYLLDAQIKKVMSLLPVADRLSVYDNEFVGKQRLFYVKALLHGSTKSYAHAISWFEKLQLNKLDSKRDLAIENNDLIMQHIFWLMNTGQASTAQSQISQLQTSLLSVENQKQHKLKDYLSKELSVQQLEQAQLKELHTQQVFDLKVSHYAEAKRQQTQIYWLISIIVFLILFAVYYFFIRGKRSIAWYEGLRMLPHEALVNAHKELKYTTGLVLFDIDNVKKLNQRFGHNSVDDILKGYIELLTTRTKQVHHIYQLSGDRFLLIAKNFTQYQTLILAELLRKELNTTTELRHELDLTWLPPVTASFVVTKVKVHESLDALKDRMVNELQKVKSSGGDKTAQLLIEEPYTTK